MQKILDKYKENFICSISYDTLQEPVITEDGHTYEKEHITEWLKEHSTSPNTRKTISKILTPNIKLASVISEFKQLEEELNNLFIEKKE